MAYGGEIATMFVRLRPNINGFAAEATQSVKATLKGIQAEVASSARANVAAASQEVDVNRMLAESYAAIASGAKAGSVEQQTAMSLSSKAAADAGVVIRETAQANVASAMKQIDQNAYLAATYTMIGKAAKEGSEQQMVAYRLAAQAARAAAVTAQEIVMATEQEVLANLKLADSYRAIAAVAIEGSKEQQVAMKLAADAAASAAAIIGSTAAENVQVVARQVMDNQALAATYKEIAAQAVAGSEEQRVALRLAASAAEQANGVMVSSAKASVDATVQQVAELRALAAEYGAVAAAAVRGSEVQKAALAASGRASSEANGLLGASAVKAEGHVRSLRSRIFSLSTVLGVGIGADFAVKFAKDITGSAASVQKSAEVIKAEFGKDASQVLVRFGDTVAAKLGISAELADRTSARFGILFKNLGIGVGRAAGMTVGLEKLGGSLAAIRGVDPSAVFERLPLALAGNVRGLKQLGLGIDQTQIKVAALKLGLISSIHDALTPGIRAQAIYALATANLSTFQQQAAKHANDYANMQRRLSAEWSNAKDILGTALLPTFNHYVSSLTEWLKRMIESGKLQRDFNAIAHTTAAVVSDVARAISTGWHIFQVAAGWIGGTKNALILLIGVMAIGKLQAVGLAFLRIGTMVAGIGRAAQGAAALFGISMGVMDAEAVATAATIQAALISTGIGALVVAVGVAVAEIIMHWDTVKRWLTEFGHWIGDHAKELFFLPVIGPIIFLVTEIVRHFDTVKTVFRDVAQFFGTVFVHPIRAVETAFKQIESAVISVFKNIVGTVGHLLAAIPSWLPGLGKFHSWGKSLEGWAATTGDAVGATLGTHIANGLKTVHGLLVNPFNSVATLVDGLAKKTSGSFEKVIKDIPNIVPVKIQLELAQARTPSAQRRALTDELMALNKELAQNLALPLRVQVEQEKTAVLSELRSLTSTATTAVTNHGNAVATATKNATQRVTQAVSAAKNNLDAIGQKLAESVNKVIDKFGAATTVNPAQEAAFKRLRDIIGGGGSTPDLLRAAQGLAGQLQNQASKSGASTVQARRDAIKRDFSNLTSEFNHNQLSVVQFNRKVAALLKADHVTYGEAGKLLGKGFADNFRSQITALHEQAGAIAALPAKFRSGGQGGDSQIKIIQPLQVMRAENAKVAVIAERQRERQIKAAERAAKAGEKNNKLIAQIDKTKLGTLPGTTSEKAKKAAKAGIRP